MASFFIKVYFGLEERRIYMLRKAVLTLAMLLGPLTASAEFLTYDPDLWDRWDSNLSLYTGYVTGKSKEIVYNHSHILSQLDWKIHNLWVLGGTAEVSGFEDTFHFSLDGWCKLHADKSTMVDRDYRNLQNPSDLTDLGEHPDTSLKTAYLIDFEMDYDVCCFSQECFETKIGFLLGYRYLKLHWDACGGTISDAERSVEIPSGVFCISFLETISIPYIGLKIDWQWGDCVDVRAFGKFTGIAYAKDRDVHALTNTVFVDKFCNTQYWVAGLEARWYIWECLSFDLRYSFEQLTHSRGHTTIRGFNKKMHHNSAGLEHQQQLFAAGVTAYF